MPRPSAKRDFAHRSCRDRGAGRRRHFRAPLKEHHADHFAHQKVRDDGEIASANARMPRRPFRAASGSLLPSGCAYGFDDLLTMHGFAEMPHRIKSGRSLHRLLINFTGQENHGSPELQLEQFRTFNAVPLTG